ncbi:hypothetical protein PsYK624_054290 [Phanerochaete sordida]|uniref:Uncharacterized protein n=1 Tax=Phanerochaete sordida TaxID=48140 RepID=A0A9P3G7N2_9APHY|nr:hypothetical protein PsYK624_054290 [Phanerochaete sordida]
MTWLVHLPTSTCFPSTCSAPSPASRALSTGCSQPTVTFSEVPTGSRSHRNAQKQGRGFIDVENMFLWAVAKDMATWTRFIIRFSPACAKKSGWEDLGKISATARPGWLATTPSLYVVKTRIRVYTLPRWLVNIATRTDLPWHAIFNFELLTAPRSPTLFPPPSALKYSPIETPNHTTVRLQASLPRMCHTGLHSSRRSGAQRHDSLRPPRGRGHRHERRPWDVRVTSCAFRSTPFLEMHAGLHFDIMLSGKVLGFYEAFALSLPCAIPSPKLSLHTRISTPPLSHTVQSRVDARIPPCYAAYRTSPASYAGGADFPATLSPLALSGHSALTRCISPLPADCVLPPDASNADGHCSCRYNELNDAWLTSTGGMAVEGTSGNGATPVSGGP